MFALNAYYHCPHPIPMMSMGDLELQIQVYSSNKERKAAPICDNISLETIDLLCSLNVILLHSLIRAQAATQANLLAEYVVLESPTSTLSSTKALFIQYMKTPKLPASKSP